jgi:hypothetical protein
MKKMQKKSKVREKKKIKKNLNEDIKSENE